ncbi:hypothetical protein CHARACLAT_020747 [Characodon lateralis]|uniref:Uncharacterized protein n=1 Tax=Characodon lateralis TaxID=208331 RepID=A0ABU7D024_9TELE|nr:hypothetical protein [Characodon lateralis]
MINTFYLVRNIKISTTEAIERLSRLTVSWWPLPVEKSLFLSASDMLISSASVRPYWLFVRVNFPFQALRQGGYSALKLICCVIPVKKRNQRCEADSRLVLPSTISPLT